MTKIVVYRNKDERIKKFEITGHTDFDLSGSDVLCAAVSTLVSHTIGSVQEFTNEPCINTVDEQAPKVVFELTAPDDELTKESGMLLEAFASSADDLAFAHPDNLVTEYRSV